MKKFIYVLYCVDLKKLTDDDIQKDFEKFKNSSPHPETVDFNRYIEFCNMFHHDHRYHVYEEIVAYLDTEEDAVECAINDFGGYNEAGSFGYGVVAKQPIGYAYPNTCSDATYRLFHYNHDKGIYEEVTEFDEDEEAIMRTFDMFYDVKENNPV